MNSIELNFDGLVGPTHNYSGLAYGNLASIENKNLKSSPKQAALQGLAKMKMLMDLGIPQAILPPHERPYIELLRNLGFNGSDSELLKKVYKQFPELLFSCSSASSMWAANSATITPSVDSAERLVEITPANLFSKLHRSIEAPFTAVILKQIFSDETIFKHHPPLVASNAFADEGAANHTRFCSSFDQPGLHLFVYGKKEFSSNAPRIPGRYPPRQTLEASQTIARTHQLQPDCVVFAQQSPLAIDEGVFHNDVISVGHQNLFFYHEQAFVETEKVVEELTQKFKKISGEQLILIKVSSGRISLTEAVSSYLFNSQIVTLPDKTMKLIAPSECLEMPSVNAFLEELVDDQNNPITNIEYLNLHESMKNGGGPACLRLRVVLNEKEFEKMNQSFLLTNQLFEQLSHWIEQYYRDELSPADLAAPELLQESRSALDALTGLLRLGPVYPFQK